MKLSVKILAVAGLLTLSAIAYIAVTALWALYAPPPAAPAAPLPTPAEIRARAEKGDAAAQERLASSMSGSEAVEWYRKSAEQGNRQAQARLGYIFDNGKGVPKNPEEATKYWKMLVEQDSLIGQRFLTLLYNRGDYSEAEWYRQSADITYWLLDGLEADAHCGDAKTVALTQKAAAQGDRVAYFRLGVMYYVGEGVPRNYEEAYAWMSLAAAQDFRSTKVLLDEMEKRFTPAQIASAQKRAAEIPLKIHDTRK